MLSCSQADTVKRLTRERGDDTEANSETADLGKLVAFGISRSGRLLSSLFDLLQSWMLTTAS